MTEPPGARLRVGLTGLTVAEYFRDEEGQDVLLFIDNIFRFTQAGSEVSALLGRMPSAVGYQPNLATEMGELQERITSTKKGSITSVQAIYVPADDYTDPAPATTFAHLDATTNLSRAISELGIYPAVDPLASTSRILDPRIIGEEHYDVAQPVKPILQRYKDLQDIIAILGVDELSRRRQADRGARAQDPALPFAAVPRGRAVHRLRRASTSSWPTPSAASRKSWKASTTTCPSRRSTCRARSKTCMEKAKTMEARRNAWRIRSNSKSPRRSGSWSKEAVTEAQIPAKDGYIGVLPGHAPLLSLLGSGVLSYTPQAGPRKVLAIHRRFRGSAAGSRARAGEPGGTRRRDRFGKSPGRLKRRTNAWRCTARARDRPGRSAGGIRTGDGARDRGGAEVEAHK